MSDVEGRPSRFGILREGLRSVGLWALVFAVCVCGVLFFPWAVAAIGYEAVDGYRLSNGLDGESGTVVVDHIETGYRQTSLCKGTFTPDGGGLAIEDVRVEVPGDCEIGQRATARLADERPALFSNVGDRTAWASGSKDWIGWVMLLVVAAIGAIPFTIGAAIFVCISGLAVGTEIYVTASRLRHGD